MILENNMIYLYRKIFFPSDQMQDSFLMQFIINEVISFPIVSNISTPLVGQLVEGSLLCNVPTLLSQFSVSADMHGCHPGSSEAAVMSVQAWVLLPDPPHTAAGDDWLTVNRRDPKPPADVLSVSTVTHSRGLAWLSR